MTRAAQNLLSPSHLRDHPWGSATTQTCVYLLHGLEGSVTPLVMALHLEMTALMSGQRGLQQWQQGLCAPWKWHPSGAATEQRVARELLRCQPWPRHAVSSHRLCSACLGTAGITSSPVQLPSSPQSRSGFVADPGLPAVSQPPRARCRDHQHQAVSGQAPSPLFPHPHCSRHSHYPRGPCKHPAASRGWIHPRTTLRPPEAPASHLPAVSRRDQPWRRPGPAVLVPSWQGVAMTTSCLLRSPPAPGARRCGAQGPTTRPPPVPLQPCGDVGLAPNALCHAGRATGYHKPQAFSLACSCRLRCLLCPREHPSPGPPVAQALCPLVPLLLQRCHTAGVHCSCLPALPRIVLLGFSHAPEPPVTNRAS